MIRINLLPVRAAKKKETFMNQIYVGVLVLALTFAGVGFQAFSQKGKISRLRSDIGAREKELKDLKEVVEKVEEFEAKKEVLQQKIDLITDLEQGREHFIQIVDVISQAIPGGAWVSSVSFKGKGGKSKEASGVSLRGAAYEKDDVGIFIGNLKAQNQYVKAVQLGSLSASGRGSATSSLYNFDMVITPQAEKKAEAAADTGKGKKQRKQQ